MLRIAGQTTGPIGLSFILDTHAWQTKIQKFLKFFFSKFFFPRATPGPSASHS